MTDVIHQRCWNHEAREAICRCPECGRSCRPAYTALREAAVCLGLGAGITLILTGGVPQSPQIDGRLMDS